MIMNNMMPGSYLTDMPFKNVTYVTKSEKSAFSDSPKSSPNQKINNCSNSSYPSMISQLLQTTAGTQMTNMDAQTTNSNAYAPDLNCLAYEMTRMVNPILSPYELNISYDNFCW